MERRLDFVKLEMKDEFAVTVVLASGGYPGSYTKGKEITISSVPSSKSPLFLSGIDANY